MRRKRKFRKKLDFRGSAGEAPLGGEKRGVTPVIAIPNQGPKK